MFTTLCCMFCMNWLNVNSGFQKCWCRESGAKISLLEFSFISLNTVCLCTFCHHFDWFNFIPFVFVQILLQRHLAFHTSPVKSNLITRSYNAKLEISDIFRATFPKMLMMTLMLHDYPCLSHGVTIPAGQRLSFINLLGVQQQCSYHSSFIMCHLSLLIQLRQLSSSLPLSHSLCRLNAFLNGRNDGGLAHRKWRVLEQEQDYKETNQPYHVLRLQHGLLVGDVILGSMYHEVKFVLEQKYLTQSNLPCTVQRSPKISTKTSHAGTN